MVGVHPDRVEMFIKKSLESLQLDYVDLYLIHFPVGAKFKEGTVRPYLNDNGEIALEPKTDHAALWKVPNYFVHKNQFALLVFISENGRASRRRTHQEHRFIKLQHLPNHHSPQIRKNQAS